MCDSVMGAQRSQLCQTLTFSQKQLDHQSVMHNVLASVSRSQAHRMTRRGVASRRRQTAFKIVASTRRDLLVGMLAVVSLLCAPRCMRAGALRR